MARTPTLSARPKVLAAVLAAAAAAIIGAGFWAIRGGPGDAPPNGGDGRGGASAGADSVAAGPSAMLRVPGNGAPVIGAFDRRIREQLASHPAPSRPLSGSLTIDAEDLVWREPSGGDRKSVV